MRMIKDKQLHFDPWRHCNVKVTTPCYMYVVSQCIQELLEALFTFFKYKKGIFNSEQENENIIHVRIG